MERKEIEEKVKHFLIEDLEIDEDKIAPGAKLKDDLGIDSLDFLDIVFAIDKEFGIKVPLEKWTQEVNDGKGLKFARGLKVYFQFILPILILILVWQGLR